MLCRYRVTHLLLLQLVQGVSLVHRLLKLTGQWRLRLQREKRFSLLKKLFSPLAFEDLYSGAWSTHTVGTGFTLNALPEVRKITDQYP